MTESVDGTRDKDHRPEEVDRAYNESKSSDAKKTQRDWTDNFGSITTFIASVIIGGAGVWSSHIYNSAQVEVKRLEIREEEERKDREEVRHSQVELAEALDKYAHYIFSSNVKERQFGYSLFSSLGQTDIALKIGELGSDPAALKLAELQVNSKDPSIRQQANQTRSTAGEAFIKQVQSSLCLAEPDGLLNPLTIQAIQSYLRGASRPVPENIDPLASSIQPDLADAVNAVQNCKEMGFKNAYEVGAFGVSSEDSADNIKEVQRNLNRVLKQKRSDLVISETGKFDSQTREAIREFRRLNSLSEGDEIDLQVDKLLASPLR
jgi:hypothetical protein